MKFEAALFDLDGTLVDTEPRSRAAWKRLFGSYGVPHDDDLLRSFAGRPGKVVLAEQLGLFPPGSSVDDLFAEAMSYATAAAEPVRGAVELVRSLHARIPVGVVTSGTRDYAEAELEAIDVRRLLAVLITAEDVRKGKPDPEGYLAGCRALGVEPARTVVFEDSPAGVAAAKAAGAYCVGIGTSQPAGLLTEADLVVPDLTSLPPWCA
jgi:sugar-phosphatase